MPEVGFGECHVACGKIIVADVLVDLGGFGLSKCLAVALQGVLVEIFLLKSLGQA